MPSEKTLPATRVQSIVHASSVERPILFSGAMVRAILDGKKTQTRRIVKPQPETTHNGEPYWHIGGFRVRRDPPCGNNPLPCPYGKANDRLWVRETHCHYGDRYIYRADYGQFTPISDGIGGPWKPSIHMPRKASRISLEITAVSVERLKAISEEDAIAEGIGHSDVDAAVADYAALWERINGVGSWEVNPLVWVVQFSRV